MFRLHAHLRRINVVDTAQCQCGTAEETPAHILQECPIYSDVRSQIWPEGADLKDKLWGTLDDLARTALFVNTTNLRV